MKKIPLTLGLSTTVDDDDYDWLVAMGAWYAIQIDGKFYAAFDHQFEDGSWATVLMHELIGVTMQREASGDNSGEIGVQPDAFPVYRRVYPRQ